MFVKTTDRVRVIAGKDKGKEGVVTRVFPKNNHVIVKGINMVKKHQKPTQDNPQGSVTDVEAPIDASNIQLLDPKDGKPTRVGYKEVDGKKVRYAKKSGQTIEYAAPAEDAKDDKKSAKDDK
ncbi:MAG: 50S ribosomal protein L24 [Schleiferilactobacillus perolens]|jgi:large subunit ribosomal protein L24|uniref:Large ribosomal subunit protein uL24 n=1 Tax=Schleiferilactobacillus perolens DSM 12744 TaxID=1423792 RepID=A0A0R1N0H6_9LACO|nr:50S ribosomal protein L24 [Schleiferilactobacillus perolens]KRL13273.1 hypothetical protein FD09_GL002100 [Schleiferilactobacillus perolens DSM 12744]MCI1891765.1 50S ribosomal protein L24 [Schleiferilactobacillus harbinensis]MCI1912632.1 50S ribosomal protein L24 [Schleiferilactobacillus harbinensis]